MAENPFDAETVHEIFKIVWSRKAQDRERDERVDDFENEEAHRRRGANLPLARSAFLIVGGLGFIYYISTLWCAFIGYILTGLSFLSANSNALKLSCELLRIFVTEAVQRAAIIAEAEGAEKVEATHLERVLPQLLLDF